MSSEVRPDSGLPRGEIAGTAGPRVRDLMVPLSEYATVRQDATVRDAVEALEEARQKYQRSPHQHRAVLVVDEEGEVVGKLSHWVLLRVLEPKHADDGNFNVIRGFGFSRHFIRQIVEKEGLWWDSLEEVCRRAARIKVCDIMYTPEEGEYVDEDALIERAINQLVDGHHQSLLVTRGGKVMGILRMVDVFSHVCGRMLACDP